MSDEWIAVSDLIAVDANGTRRDVVLRIGMPRPAKSADWMCPVDLQGLESQPIEIFGVDSLQALGLAYAFVGRMALAFEQAGGQFEFADGEPVSMVEYFLRFETS